MLIFKVLWNSILSSLVPSVRINGMQNSYLGSLVYSAQIAATVLCELYANTEVQNLHDMLYTCKNMQSVFLRFNKSIK